MVIVKIESFDEKGLGLGNGIHVPFAYPKDVVEVKIWRKRKMKVGEIERIIEKSPYRTEEEYCKHLGKCGGCLWGLMDYKYQLTFKQQIIKNLFSEFDTEIREIVPSPKTLYYRNKMEYVITEKGVSFREPLKWWAFHKLEECKLLSKEAKIIIQKFNELKEKFNIPAWDMKKHTGFLRYLVIREGKFTGERMLYIVTYERKKFEELWNFIEEVKDLVTSVYWGIRRDRGDEAKGEELKHYYGSRYLREQINDIIYYISPNVFFQTNSYQAVNYVKTVKEFLDLQKDDIVLDLYSGLGFFSLQIANEVERVIGVDIDREAIELARINAQINGIDNVGFFVEDAGKININEKISKVIVDPPRAGMSKKVMKRVLELKPKKIVYVSCNPRTQKRDIEYFVQAGYKLIAVRPFDSFPHTPHIGSIALLERK